MNTQAANAIWEMNEFAEGKLAHPRRAKLVIEQALSSGPGVAEEYEVTAASWGKAAHANC